MKKLAAIILISAMLLGLSACTFPDITDYLASITYTEAPTAAPFDSSKTRNTSEPTAEPTPEPTPVPTEDPYPLPDGAAEGLGEYARRRVYEASLIMDEVVGHISANPIAGGSETSPFVGANRYRELSQEGLVLYERLLSCAKSFIQYRTICAASLMEAVTEALFIDHPELEIYFAVQGTEGDSRTSYGGQEPDPNRSVSYSTIFFEPEGRYFGPADDMDKVREQVEAFEAVGSYIASRIPESFSAIDKYRCIASYIDANSSYAYIENEEIPRYAMTAYGAVINGWSICQGYTLGFEYLCRAANLDCRRLTNGLTDNSMHYWDEITLPEGTYYVDVTWSDGSSETYSDQSWFDWFVFPADDQHVANDGTTTTGEAFVKTDWK